MRKSCLLVALMLVLMIRSSLSMTKCKKHQLEALLKFKHSFTQDPLRVLSSWVGDDCCQWRGVSCDSVNGNVVKLNLTNSLAYSDYPTSLVSSELSSALLDLKFLTHLDLSGNNFTGSRIPKFLGSMTHLRYLTLSYSGFSGPIPPQLGNLTNLIHLELGDFVGHMIYTEERLDWVSGLSKLEFLDMSGTNMSQTYDTFQVLITLPSLLVVSLSSCSLDETHLSEVRITNTSSLKRLESLSLYFNSFSGDVPILLGNMTHLHILDLRENELNGSLPSQLGQLTNLNYLYLSDNKLNGSLPSQLGQLTKLNYLDLSDNKLNGSLPSQLGQLTKLRYLDFSNAGISGPIPPQIGNLTNLIHLDLSNDEGGYFILHTEESLEWASSLSKLQSLDMSDIDMSQAYDSLQVLFRLPSLLVVSLSSCSLNNTHLSELRITNTSYLKHLDLSYNNFEGHIPSFLKNMPFSGDIPIWLCNMTHLHFLHLGQNELNGSLPSQLGQLTNLNYLYLFHNEFHGPVPTSLANLSALGQLDLSNNNLSGLIPDVLRVLGHLTELEYLDISSTFIQGTVSHIGNLSKLLTLGMNFNKIKLNLSTNWRPPFQLQVLRVHSCQLNTAFPQWLRNQTQITGLDLSYTGISGEIPQWLWNLTNLQLLQLGGNKLTGSLPSHITCDGCKLWWLDLHNNMLSGTIPHWLKHLKTIWLLDLSENLLSGRIFETRNGSSLLSGTNRLFLLDLSNNMLSGEIQVKNAYSPEFQFLSLRGNDFSGLINSQLCNLTNLSILELAHNRLTGHIPHCLGSLIFESGGEYGSEIETREIIKGTTENFNGTMSTHSMIDLSCNLLTGTIPEELANITNLMQLNLSNNRLTGGIPDDIGNLQLLESLDLSSNNLSGTIPQSLSNIPWLSVLNLPYNDLYGPIPTGRQLQTLADPSIYAGNSGLCGFPLPNTCTNSNSPPSPTDHDHGGEEDDDSGDKHDKLWLYLAVLYGVITGFWVVVGTLVLKKRWRHAYFRFVEKTADRIYVPFKVRMNRFKTENSG